MTRHAKASPPYTTRRTWFGDEKIQQSQPLRWYQPETLDEIVDIVRCAEEAGCHVKAVGTGQSYSDITATHDFLVDMRSVRHVGPVAPDRLRCPERAEAFVEVGAGALVRDLNAHLERVGRALLTMASYDGMTFVGTALTGSHGSGPRIGAVASQIRSVLLVTGGGRVLRVEPTDGITARCEPGVTLVQDDRLFDAVAVSIGTLGVVHSVVVETVPAYLLHEVRTLERWSDLRARLEDGSLLAQHHWVEIWVNPHVVDGDRSVLLTVRDIVDRPPPGTRGRRPWLPSVVATLPLVSGLALWMLHHFPSRSAWVVEQALRALVDDRFVGPPGKVLIDALAPSGFANELHFPLRDGIWLRAVDRYFELAEKYLSLGDRYMNLLAIRFVAPTQHYLSMNHGEATVSVELPTLTEWFGSRDLFDDVQRNMIELGGRPHWALEFGTLTDAGGLVRSMYPKFDAFVAVRNELDPNGTFASSFTVRTGMTPVRFGRPPAPEPRLEPVRETCDSTGTAQPHR